MAEFVMLQTGDDGILAAGDARARRQMARDAVRQLQIVGLEFLHGRKVGREVLADFLEVRLFEGFDAGGNTLVGDDDHRHAVFAGDVHRIDRGVEAIFDVGWGNHNAR